MDLIAFEELVVSRRSVRIFDPSPMPEAVVEKCLELALLAPNSSNLQPWEFHWVKSEKAKNDLVAACFSQSAAKTAAELIVCVARTKTWKQARTNILGQLRAAEAAGVKIPKAAWHYYLKLVPMMYQQGWFSLLGYLKKVLFFVIGLKKPMMREPTSRHQMKVWAVKSTALACENLMLAARAQGYDSCPMEGMDSRRIRKLLKLSADAQVVMVIALGKRSINGITLPRMRGERSRAVYRH